MLKGKPLNVGRALALTLMFMLLAEHESVIENFKKEKFYTDDLDLQVFQTASGRFNFRTDAGKLRAVCLGQSVTQKGKTKRPTKLYGLVILQRKTNRLFSYITQQTFDYLPSQPLHGSC